MSEEQKSAERFPELYKLMESILSDTLTHLSWKRSSIYEILEATEEAVAVERERCAVLVEEGCKCGWIDDHNVNEVAEAIRSSSPTYQKTIEKIRRAGATDMNNRCADFIRIELEIHGLLSPLHKPVEKLRALLADGEEG